MDLVRFQCPGCGAELPPRAPTGEVVCQYCGSRFAPAQARSAKTSAGQSLDPEALEQLRKAHEELSKTKAQLSAAREAKREARREAKRARKEARESGGPLAWLGAGVRGLLTLLFIAAVLTISLLSSGVLSLEDIPGLRELDLTETLEAELDPEGVDPWSGPPQLAMIGDQPVLIVRVREHERQQLFVDAYELPPLGTAGADDRPNRRWRIGPLATGKGLEHARMVVAGAFVVVSDDGRELFVHELATGTRVRSLDLRGEVDYLCLVPTGASEGEQVYVRLSKRGHQLLDVATGKLARASKEPPGCETWRGAELDPSLLGGDAVQWIEALDGVEALRIHLGPGSKQGAALLADTVEGGRSLRLIGFADDGERKRGKLRVGATTWEQVLGAGEPIATTVADDRVLTLWQPEGATLRLEAHALADGAPPWSRVLELEAGDRALGLHAGLGYVVVVRSHAVDILDAATGAKLAGLGQPPQ
ncbi:MAG: hypothetical protein KC431_08715 [Myxococcales bacterium]|nr:hypothetical protein [Myxococcales bacterium]